MNKFIILVTIAAAVVAEPPVSGGYSGGGSVSAGRSFAFGGSSGGSSGSGINEYVDEALLARVAAVIQSNGDGTAQGQDNEGSQYVDAGIFSRVAQSLGNGGSSGGRVSSEYGAPAPGGEASLGNPEPAQRIAEWDLSETRQSSGSQGGYSGPVPQPSGGYPAPAPAQQGGYSAPSRSASSGGQISLGRPEPAQRVAEFDASAQQQQQQQSRQSGGYN